MKKRLLAAILSIALVVSLFSAMMVSPVGAAAATDYTGDRAALKQAIIDAVVVGPRLDVRTEEYLHMMGIWNMAASDGSVTTRNGAVGTNRIGNMAGQGTTLAQFSEANRTVVYNASKTYGDKNYLNYIKFHTNMTWNSADDLYAYFISDANKFLTSLEGEYLNNKAGWTAATADANGNDADKAEEIYYNIQDLIRYTASVYYFAQRENDTAIDPTFNSARNALVKNATALLNNYLKALRAQVTNAAINAAKGQTSKTVGLVGYAAEWFGNDYKNFVNLTDRYNYNLGINPYIAFKDSSNAWWTNFFTNVKNDVSAFYAPSLLTVPGINMWYTFDTLNANAAWKPLLEAFNLELRKVQAIQPEGILYYEFVNEVKPAFMNTWDALVKAILGDDIMKSTLSFDMNDIAQTYLKLVGIVSVYEKYVLDLYNNVYVSAEALALRYDVIVAKQFIEFIQHDGLKLLALQGAALDELVARLEDGLENVAMYDYQVITQANIDAASKTIREAEALLAAYPITGSVYNNLHAITGADDAARKTAYSVYYNNLKTAVKNLKDMLPAYAGTNARMIVDAKANAGADSLKDKTGHAGNWYVIDILGKKLVTEGYTVEFVPNYFAYVQYLTALNEQIVEFTNVINTKYVVASSALSSYSNADLLAALNPYAFLMGFVGTNVNGVVGNASELAILIYTYYLYETVFDPAFDGRINMPVAGTTITTKLNDNAGKEVDEIVEQMWAITTGDKWIRNLSVPRGGSEPFFGKDWIIWAWKNVFVTDFDSLGLDIYGDTFSSADVIVPLDGESFKKTLSGGMIEKVLGQTYVNKDEEDRNNYNIPAYYEYFAALYNASVFSSAYVRALEYAYDADKLNAAYGNDKKVFIDWENVNDPMAPFASENLYVKAIDEFKGFLYALTGDITREIQEYRYIFNQIVEFFGDEASYAAYTEADGVNPDNPYNYPAKYYEIYLTAVAKMEARLDIDGNGVYDDYFTEKQNQQLEQGLTTATNLKSAYNEFVDAARLLMTDLGEQGFDNFLTAVDNVLYNSPITYGTGYEFLEYEWLLAKLNMSRVHLDQYIPAFPALPYEYFGFTLKTVAEDFQALNNPYAFDAEMFVPEYGFGTTNVEPLRVNFYAQLVNALTALGGGVNVDKFECAESVAKEAAELKRIGRILYNAIHFGTGANNTVLNAVSLPVADTQTADMTTYVEYEGKFYNLAGIWNGSLVVAEVNGVDQLFTVIPAISEAQFLYEKASLVKPTGEYVGAKLFAEGEGAVSANDLMFYTDDVATWNGGNTASIVNVDEDYISTDMPLWYAQKILAELQAMVAKVNANSKAAIAAKKGEAGGLNALIEEASAKNAFGYEKGDSASDAVWTAFKNAYNTAVTVKYNLTADIDKVVAAADALKAAMAALDGIEQKDATTIDDLKAVLAKAETTLDRYDLLDTNAKVVALEKAIVAANNYVAYASGVVNAADTAKQIATLEAAIKAVQNDVYLSDALSADIAALEKGLNEADYTSASWKTFKAAIENAKLVAADEASTVTECMAAYEAVKNAKAALVREVKTEVEKVVEKEVEVEVVVNNFKAEAEAFYAENKADYDALDAAAYSADSYAAYGAALEALNAAIKADAAEADLIDLVVKVALAKASLEEANPHTLDA